VTQWTRGLIRVSRRRRCYGCKGFSESLGDVIGHFVDHARDNVVLVLVVLIMVVVVIVIVVAIVVVNSMRAAM
jgi:hypothetical protein